MEKRWPRRTMLTTAVVGAGAVLLGARGGGPGAAANDGNRYGGGGNAGRVGASVNRQGNGQMATPTGQDLWERWVALWNGDVAVADEIIAQGFVAHFAPLAGSSAEVRGPEGLTQWIGGLTAPFPGYRFSTDVGPIVDGDLIAGRWVFRATYQGGFPGAAADAVGRNVEYAGADILRVEAGQIAEYWLSADVMQLLQQLGVLPS